MGFKALGLDVFPVATAVEAKDTLRQLTRESEDEYAIIYIEENLAMSLEHEIEKFKDFGGVRIEDDVLITPTGCRFLGKERIPYHVSEVEEYLAAHADQSPIIF